MSLLLVRSYRLLSSDILDNPLECQLHPVATYGTFPLAWAGSSDDVGAMTTAVAVYAFFAHSE